MNRFSRRRRVALAALLATTAIGSAMPAQASTTAAPADCATRYEQLETRFREIEERRGWEAAAKWWQKAWAKYHDDCVLNPA